MNPQQAHQLANPKILKLLNELNHVKICIICGDFIGLVKSELKGILIAQEKEVEFLGKEIKFNSRKECFYCSDRFNKIIKRLEALKISNEDLRKVLK